MCWLIRSVSAIVLTTWGVEGGWCVVSVREREGDVRGASRCDGYGAHGRTSVGERELGERGGGGGES